MSMLLSVEQIHLYSCLAKNSTQLELTENLTIAPLQRFHAVNWPK